MPLAAKSTAAATTTSSLLRRVRGRPAALALVARFPPSSSSSSLLPQPFGGGEVAVGKTTTRTAGTHYRSCSTTTATSALLGSRLRDSPSTRLLSSSSASASASTSSSSSVIEEPERQPAAAAAQASVDTSSTTTNINNMPDKMWTEARVPPTPSELLETNRQWHADADPEMFASLSKGQKPAIAWIGCSDSRVPAELVTGAAPGDLFVHRNIANTFNPKDPSALAFLAYAVNALGVSHVIVCGHKNCGGVQAALASAKERQANNVEVDEGTEAIQNWLTPLRALAVANLRTSSSFAAEVDPTKSLHALVEQNVCAQVSNVASCSVVKNAWRQGKSLTIHGWVYDLSTGKIEDLKVSEGTGITDTKN